MIPLNEPQLCVQAGGDSWLAGAWRASRPA